MVMVANQPPGATIPCMPELPEIETLKRSIAPRIMGRKIMGVVARRPGLRLPFPDLQGLLAGRQVIGVGRRSKYLLIDVGTGKLLVHLGMSGNLRWVEHGAPVAKHDHLDIVFEHGILRLNDARRFGMVDFEPVGQVHQCLTTLGPEPLDGTFTGAVLYARVQGRKTPIKVAIMDAKIVVGVGNIYASEALFCAGIHPLTPAGKVSGKKIDQLVACIKSILAQSIKVGGSTLKDFRGLDGEHGDYVSGNSRVYGRAGQPCTKCKTILESGVIGGRASVWCPKCQVVEGR